MTRAMPLAIEFSSFRAGRETFKTRSKRRTRFRRGINHGDGYEVYRAEEHLYWYDDFPHPNDPTLASTFPHHNHVPSDPKHNRIPAPEMSFTHPNLSVLIQEIEEHAED
jgi:hypothetical protein